MGSTQSRSGGRSKKNSSSSADGCCSEDACCGPSFWTGPIIMGFVVMGCTLVTFGLSFSEVVQKRVMASQSWLYYTIAMFSVTTAATVIFIILSALGHRVGGRMHPHGSNYHPYFLLFGGAWTLPVIQWAALARFRSTFNSADLAAFDDFDSNSWTTSQGLQMLIFWTAIFTVQAGFALVVTILYWNTVDRELHPVVSAPSAGAGESTPLNSVSQS